MSIEVRKDGAIGTVRFARPEKLNALTLAMYDALGKAFVEMRDDPEIRVVVLAGAGDRAFCVGADLIESIPALASGRMDITAWDPAHLKGARFYKPIVAAIKGLCLGGGFEIALATDIRVASDTAEFQLPEPGLGFVPAGGTLVRLVRQIGYAPAMEILLTARRFSAADMHAAGVLNHVVGAEDVEPLAYRIAGEIAALSPGAVQTIKEATLILQDLPMDDAFAAEAVLGRRTFTSADARQALAAFAQRAAAGKTK